MFRSKPMADTATPAAKGRYSIAATPFCGYRARSLRVIMVVPAGESTRPRRCDGSVGGDRMTGFWEDYRRVGRDGAGPGCYRPGTRGRYAASLGGTTVGLPATLLPSSSCKSPHNPVILSSCPRRTALRGGRGGARLRCCGILSRQPYRRGSMGEGLYPLTFEPMLRNYMWGGRRLERLYGRTLPPGIVAESWEVSAHPSSPTTVAQGPLAGLTLPEVVARLGLDLLGEHSRDVLDRGRFPLLVKLLDANALRCRCTPTTPRPAPTAATWARPRCGTCCTPSRAARSSTG